MIGKEKKMKKYYNNRLIIRNSEEVDNLAALIFLNFFLLFNAIE